MLIGIAHALDDRKSTGVYDIFVGSSLVYCSSKKQLIGASYMYGGGAGTMTLDELHSLEKYLEIWMYHIRSAKMDIMFQEIQLLKNKVRQYPDFILQVWGGYR
ncbi:hypothetical protein HAX54_048551 [Datura stramonium]|uniref:K-box domain-containing protein n=1 Tax=Datura stramonium TaxID=4076 RepID=A0ABS8WJE0_DATST|nr:hypothetical protein [Datura stramonium]